MQRTALGLILAMVLMVALVDSALAQPAPEFKLGFKALADQVPQVVGSPLENEHWGWNGDSIQQTSKGLMAWRKADNWTAFTNGSRTWVNGPVGVVERGNDERFPWEAPPPPPVYSPQVKAMDEAAIARVDTIATFMRSLENDWAAAWQWKPLKPLTIYLYSDGNRFAEAVATLRGSPLTDVERANMPNWDMAGRITDAVAGGWAIPVNLSKIGSSSNWQWLLGRLYTVIMQDELARGNSPAWFRLGFADTLSFAKVPNPPIYDIRLRALRAYRDAGNLPTVREVAQNWNAMIEAGGDTSTLANGVAAMAVSYLVDKGGVRVPLDVQKRVAVGESFEAALQAVTGYTIDRLDSEYRVKIPR